MEKAEFYWRIEWRGVFTRDIGVAVVAAPTAEDAKSSFLSDHPSRRVIAVTAQPIAYPVMSIGRVSDSLRPHYDEIEEREAFSGTPYCELNDCLRDELIQRGWMPPHVVGEFKAMFRANMLRLAPAGVDVDGELTRVFAHLDELAKRAT